MASKPEKKTGVKPALTCRAMLLCDAVIRDESTHKSSVIGIFDTFVLESMPGSTPPSKLFLLLGDGVGRYSITAEVHEPNRGVVLYRSPGAGTLGAPGKPARGELWLPVAALMFDRPGDYAIVVFADALEIGRAPFKVKVK